MENQLFIASMEYDFMVYEFCVEVLIFFIYFFVSNALFQFTSCTLVTLFHFVVLASLQILYYFTYCPCCSFCVRLLIASHLPCICHQFFLSMYSAQIPWDPCLSSAYGLVFIKLLVTVCLVLQLYSTCLVRKSKYTTTTLIFEILVLC